jgi:hypothetical protein
VSIVFLVVVVVVVSFQPGPATVLVVVLWTLLELAAPVEVEL